MSGFLPEHFVNRELSWLEFNARVLAEAESESVPLLERLKFLAIVSSNLDEFFMVRVALLHRLIASNSAFRGPDRLEPGVVLARVTARVREIVRSQYEALEGMLVSLGQKGMHLVLREAFDVQDRDFLREWFQRELEPVLTPLAVDKAHPFPLLANGGTYLYLQTRPTSEVERSSYAKTDAVLVQVPSRFPFFVQLPEQPGKSLRFAMLSDIVACFSGNLVAGYELDGAYAFRITRDADLTVDDEQSKNLLAAIEQELLTRRRGAPVRMEVGPRMPDAIVRMLQEELSLSDDETFRIPSFLDMTHLFQLESILPAEYGRNEPWAPCKHPELTECDSMMAAIRRKDYLLHLPYYRFDPVTRLVEEAADDPDVLAIKITLYRVSGDSSIVGALIRAAENGKQVTVLVELRARFDEQANIQWAKKLDQAGAHVIYGVVGYKTHSKALLIVRREPDGICRYCHLSTGNYNDKTARLYTDLGVFTANPDFGADISAFFNVITGYSLPPSWKRIAAAPFGLRDRLIALIDREVERHTPETPGLIRAKMNALVDTAIIEALYRASQAGVRVEILVRGMCRLRPGIPGVSENVRIVSIVDRFLEHPRICHFHNGGNDEVYLASADWMERNLDDRLELFFPLLDEKVRAEAMHTLDAGFADTVKAWEMLSDGTYRRVVSEAGAPVVRSQEALYQSACRHCARMASHGKENATLLLTPRQSPDGK